MKRIVILVFAVVALGLAGGTAHACPPGYTKCGPSTCCPPR